MLVLSEFFYLLNKYANASKIPTILSKPLFICARRDKYEFSPKLYNYVENVMTSIIDSTYNKNRVLVPIVFYPCQKDNIDKYVKVINQDEYYVAHHVNTLLCYPTPENNIIVERYEPGCCKYQGDLDDILRVMFLFWFNKQMEKLRPHPITINWIPTVLACPIGTQFILQDQDLCQYHVLWWIRTRLNFDFKLTYEMVVNKFHKDDFINYIENIKACFPK